MYFCPCSCNDPIDPEAEEHALVALPRNLSYVQESYLDRYSVSARYVHNPKIERSIQHEQELERAANVEDEQRRLLAAALNSADFPLKLPPSSSSPSDFSSVHRQPNNHQHFNPGPHRQVPEFRWNPSSVNGASCGASRVDSFCAGNPSNTGAPHGDGFVFHKPGCVHSNTPAGISAGVSNPTHYTKAVPDSPLPTQIELECPSDPISTTHQSVSAPLPSNNNHHTPNSANNAKSNSEPSGFNTGSLLGPAVRVASKLSALLHSPPNESMDDHRDVDLGSSVDGDSLPATSPSTDLVWNPDHLDQHIDRGMDISDTSPSLSQQESQQSTPRRVIVCDKVDVENGGLDIRDSDYENDSDLPSEPEVHDPDLFPKPFGSAGKTFFPRTDMSLSSSDQDDDLTVEEEEEEEGEEPTTVECDTNVEEMVDKKQTPSYESPDSDAFSEEGVFLNMDMDDVDSAHDRSNTVSEVSDDTCVSVDSVILSPEEGELEEEEVKRPARKMSLEEAISRAAKDLREWTMCDDDEDTACPDQDEAAMEGSTTTLEGDDTSDTEGAAASARPTLAVLGRVSPVRGLKIKIESPDGQRKEMSPSSTTLSESPVYAEDEFNFSRRNLRKSSSLKTNKTPPGTPHRKKVVRFADAMGLDLESVRHVLNMESPPRIPPSAMADLRAGIDEDRKDVGSRFLCPCFNQPGADDNFFQKVVSEKVSLENAIITDLTITGIVRVSNITFHKSVRVRYTHNNWATFHDIAATYVQNSCDGPTDRFSFSIVAPADFSAGRRLEFAVSFNAGGVEYWDSNNGRNYAFECFAKTVPTASETAWMHFI